MEKQLKIGLNPSVEVYKEVLLYSEKLKQNSPPEYQDYFIAAAKGATLINDTFSFLCESIKTGKMIFNRLKDATYINKEVNSTRVRQLTRNIIHSLIEVMTPEYYAITVVETDTTMMTRPECRDRLAYLLKRPEWEYKTECGEPKHIIHIRPEDRPRIEDELEWQLENEVLGADQYGYWHAWMVLPENRKLFDPLPER